jgi:hypothetical protein
LLYLVCAMEKTAGWNLLQLWQIMYLDINIQWCKVKTNWSMGKYLGFAYIYKLANYTLIG